MGRVAGSEAAAGWGAASPAQGRVGVAGLVSTLYDESTARHRALQLVRLEPRRRQLCYASHMAESPMELILEVRYAWH